MNDIILQVCDIMSVDTIHSFHVREHYSFLSRPWTLFIPFTSVDTIHSFHVCGHYSFLSLSFLSGPITESDYFPSYVGLHPTSSFN